MSALCVENRGYGYVFVVPNIQIFKAIFFKGLGFMGLLGTVEVVIMWWFDLKLPMQSVPITTNIVNSNPAHGDVYSIQHVIKFVGDLQQFGDFIRLLWLCRTLTCFYQKKHAQG
jgi:hypothetical protein